MHVYVYIYIYIHTHVYSSLSLSLCIYIYMVVQYDRVSRLEGPIVCYSMLYCVIVSYIILFTCICVIYIYIYIYTCLKFSLSLSVYIYIYIWLCSTIESPGLSVRQARLRHRREDLAGAGDVCSVT